MNLGERLLELRKKKGLSQEDAAYELNVTRQTISKWETDQSTPDFDKLEPICKLYDITADELINGTKKVVEEKELISNNNNLDLKRKKGLGIGISICLYFLATVEIIMTIPLGILNPIMATAIFLLICGIATGVIVFVNIAYKYNKEEFKKKKENPVAKQINEIISIIILIIYLFVSFITMAWHITWILWIIYALIEEIVKLIFMVKGDNNEKE